MRRSAVYDVAIVGAGPAGATLARLLSGRYRVLLVDRRRLWSDAAGDGRGRKPCGGLLAPDAQKMLAALGLALPKALLVDPQIFVVRTLDLCRGLERYYQRFYLNLNRERFDRWLVSLIPPGVEVREGAHLRGAEETASGVRLRLSAAGRPVTEEARVLIGADGASSSVRRVCCGDLPGPPRYAAVQEVYEAESSLPYFSALFDPRLTDFYCWTIPKDGTLLVGGAFPAGAEAPTAFRRFTAALAGNGYRLGRLVRREGCYIFRPRGLRDLCLGRRRVALAGEAAGWISPSSAEGLSYAFRSALALDAALKDEMDGFGARYRMGTRTLAANIALKNLKGVLMYTPLLRRAILASGLGSTRVLDALAGRGCPEESAGDPPQPTGAWKPDRKGQSAEGASPQSGG